MPVLRYDTGNPGATLIGGVGDALANALNPKTRAEAWLLQQRLMLENLQYQKEQRAYAAQEAARQTWGHVVPPDKMPIIANMIYQNAPTADIEREVALQSGQFIDDTTPEAYAQNRERYIRLFNKLPEGGLIDAGPKTIAANNQIRAKQAGDVESSTVMGRNIANQTTTANPVPGYLAGVGAQKQVEAAGTAAGDVAVRGYGDKPTFIPGPGGVGGGPGTGQGPQGSATLVHSRTSPALTNYSDPVYLERVYSDGSRQIGMSEGETSAYNTRASANHQQLLEASNTLASAQGLKNTLQQAQELVKYINAQGPGGTAEANLLKWFSDQTGITVNNKATAMQALDQLMQTTIPQMRKEAGVVRTAGPELAWMNKTIGSSGMDARTMYNILANDMANADIQIARAKDARSVLYGPVDGSHTMPAYIQADTDREDAMAKNVQTIQDAWGSISSQVRNPPPVAGATGAAGTAPAPTERAPLVVTPNPAETQPAAQPVVPQPVVPQPVVPQPVVPQPAQPVVPQPTFKLDPATGRVSAVGQ